MYGIVLFLLHSSSSPRRLRRHRQAHGRFFGGEGQQLSEPPACADLSAAQARQALRQAGDSQDLGITRMGKSGESPG